jgi:hypothetical protein
MTPPDPKVPQLLISADLAQKLIDYLKVRPYQEVYTLIGALLQAPRDIPPSLVEEQK